MSSVQQYPEVIDQYRARVVERRSQRMRDLLARGVERGELRDDLDVDVAVTLLVGPILYIVMMRSTAQLIDRSTSERLVDGVLRGLRAD
jgi:hypothetical protein